MHFADETKLSAPARKQKHAKLCNIVAIHVHVQLSMRDVTHCFDI